MQDICCNDQVVRPNFETLLRRISLNVGFLKVDKIALGSKSSRGDFKESRQYISEVVGAKSW